MAHLKFVTLLCLIFGATASLAADEYYVWVDENGVVNYAEKSPPGYDARRVSGSQDLKELKESMASVDDRRPGRRRPGTEPEQSETDGDEAESGQARSQPSQDDSNVDPDEVASEERAEIEEEIAKVQRRNCEIGKRNLAQLQAYARIRVRGDNGEERVLTNEEKQERIEQARETIRENCGQ